MSRSFSVSAWFAWNRKPGADMHNERFNLPLLGVGCMLVRRNPAWLCFAHLDSNCDIGGEKRGVIRRHALLWEVRNNYFLSFFALAEQHARMRRSGSQPMFLAPSLWVQCFAACSHDRRCCVRFSSEQQKLCCPPESLRAWPTGLLD